MYELMHDSLTNNVYAIYRVTDSANIPLDEGNKDYQAYLSWVAEGNTPSDFDISVLNPEVNK